MSPLTRGVEKFGTIPYHTISANLTPIEQSTQEKRPDRSVPYFSQILSLTWGPPQSVAGCGGSPSTSVHPRGIRIDVPSPSRTTICVRPRDTTASDCPCSG